jgi:hypothetical protein
MGSFCPHNRVDRSGLKKLIALSQSGEFAFRHIDYASTSRSSAQRQRREPRGWLDAARCSRGWTWVPTGRSSVSCTRRGRTFGDAAVIRWRASVSTWGANAHFMVDPDLAILAASLTLAANRRAAEALGNTPRTLPMLPSPGACSSRTAWYSFGFGLPRLVICWSIVQQSLKEDLLSMRCTAVTVTYEKYRRGRGANLAERKLH